MPRRRTAIGPLPFVAIPSLVSVLCTVGHRLALDGASAGGRSRLPDISTDIPIRGST